MRVCLLGYSPLLWNVEIGFTVGTEVEDEKKHPVVQGEMSSSAKVRRKVSTLGH